MTDREAPLTIRYDGVLRRVEGATAGGSPSRGDVTDDAVRAVADFVLAEHEGAVEVEFGDGYVYQIEVVKIGPAGATGWWAIDDDVVVKR